MKIDDPKALFDFLADLSPLGVATLLLLAALIVAYLASNVAEKLFAEEDKKSKKTLTTIVPMVIIICGIFLKFQADTSKKERLTANAVKAYLCANIQKYKSYSSLAGEIYLTPQDIARDTQAVRERMEKIKEVIEKFPDEFITAKVDEPDPLGVELTDEHAVKQIDSLLRDKQPYFQSKIVYYMTTHSKTAISYKQVRDSIDRDLYDPDIVDVILAHSKGILIPLTKRSKRENLPDTAYIVLNTKAVTAFK